MYKQTGEDLFTLANVLSVVSVILSLVIGIGTWVLIGDIMGVIPFIVIAAIGCFAAWAINAILSGFGALVVTNIEMLDVAKETLKALNAQKTEIAPVQAATNAQESGSAEQTGEVQETGDLRYEGANLQARPKTVSDGMVACSMCGAQQKENRAVCFKCGVTFIK